MLWLLRECFRVFTFRTFFRFWGPPKKGDTFEIEDGFVPVIGRHSPKETHQATPEHQAYGAFGNGVAGDNQSNVNNDNNSAVEQSPKRPFRPTILVESTSTQNICTEVNFKYVFHLFHSRMKILNCSKDKGKIYIGA